MRSTICSVPTYGMKTKGFTKKENNLLFYPIKGNLFLSNGC